MAPEPTVLTRSPWLWCTVAFERNFSRSLRISGKQWWSFILLSTLHRAQPWENEYSVNVCSIKMDVESHLILLTIFSGTTLLQMRKLMLGRLRKFPKTHSQMISWIRSRYLTSNSAFFSFPYSIFHALEIRAHIYPATHKILTLAWQ